mgnify:CR=1 FL=1
MWQLDDNLKRTNDAHQQKNTSSRGGGQWSQSAFLQQETYTTATKNLRHISVPARQSIEFA